MRRPSGLCLAAVVAGAVLVTGSTAPGERARHPPCRGGRFLIEIGRGPLLGGNAEAVAEAIVLAAPRVTVAACGTTRVRLKRGTRGTHVRARWRRCGAYRRVRLRAVIDRSCAVMQGELRWRDGVDGFTAHLSACPDGIVDAAIGEECEQGTGCGAGWACSPECRCEPAAGTTTTTASLPPGGSRLVRIACPEAILGPGDHFESPVTIDMAARPLGTYTLALRYDPDVATIEAVDGGTAIGFGAPPVTDPASFASGRTLLSAFNVQSLTLPSGVVEVARVRFDVVGSPGRSMALALDPVTLSDTGGIGIVAEAAPPCLVAVGGSARTTTTTSRTTSSSSSTSSSTTTSSRTTSVRTSTSSSSASTTTATSSSTTLPVVGWVRMICPDTMPAPGSILETEVTIEVGSRPLGAYTVAIRYDPGRVVVERIAGGDTREFSGTPITNPGSFASGRTLVSAFSSSDPTGPTGVVSAARVIFRVIGPAATGTEVGVEVITVANPTGLPIAAAAAPPCTLREAAATPPVQR